MIISTYDLLRTSIFYQTSLDPTIFCHYSKAPTTKACGKGPEKGGSVTGAEIGWSGGKLFLRSNALYTTPEGWE